ncbi:uncharacterized protein LACBIDRAFT_329518 [Laccaria bicolor S238N-H82]|uniref:Predicted protein n=1 Tax=Laccaria bicolor (strain S238N-H82 / ATCC MYA-4686) TaxID=486041 RepID=B0DIA7_LACBS|nr:uncharacterized protein LACBIDRAFT_329518 [Laccaria bicolor S238N-H82]EDR05651.1 predicted protein [Laccaria bicolor S238N-H82]|eukprot:XP_001883755.1 predicted protein [Laccaria bicolor S238N-H82]
MSVITVADGGPATEMIKLLLTHINAEEPQFKRANSSTKQILTKANDVYNEIQQLIQDIKKKMEKAEEPEWTKFKALLLDYVYNIGDRSSRLLHHTAADIPKSVASIERWATDWQITVTIVGRLRSEEFKLSDPLKNSLETGLLESLKADDIDMIRGVQDFAKGAAHKLQDDSIFDAATEDKMVTGLTGLIDNIATQMDNKYVPASAHSVVKTILLVYFPFALAADNAVDSKWAEHLKSKKVWEEMNRVVGEAAAHVTGEKEKTVEQLEENYKGLEKIIFTFTELPELFGPQLLEMMKLAGQVRRPFHGRSVVLVYMWYHLALSKDVKDERSSVNRRTITTNIKQSIEMLNSASTKLHGVKTFADDNEVKELTTKFNDNAAKMKQLYSLYKLDDKWTNDLNIKLDNAIKVDTEHYARTKARLEGQPPVTT